MEQVEQRRKNCKDEKAGLGSARTTGEPCGTMEVDVDQMAGERFACIAGVRFSEDNHVSVAGCSVESDRDHNVPGRCVGFAVESVSAQMP